MKHIGRKLFHLIGGLSLLAAYYLLGRDHALILYAVLLLVVLGLETMRFSLPAFNRFVYAWFGSFIRKNEEGKLTGTAPYILGIGSSLYLYAPGVATAAICFLAFGDVSATMVGERFGKTKIGDKSLEGTSAFVVAAMAAGGLLSLFGFGTTPWVMALGAMVAAGVELLSLPINDNLVIPLVSGGVMELALRLFR